MLMKTLMKIPGHILVNVGPMLMFSFLKNGDH